MGHRQQVAQKETVPHRPNSESTDPLTDTTTAYIALARQFADAVRFSEPDAPADRSDPVADPDATRTDMDQFAFLTAPVGQAMRDSTDSIVTGGEGIRASVRPITESAAGAFGFLFEDLTWNEEKPST